MAGLSVSAFAADVAHAGRDLKMAQACGADFLHVDVMDGHFVPLIGLGTSWLSAVRGLIKIPVEVHLMTDDTASFVPQYFEQGVASIVFHLEAEAEGAAVSLLRSIRNQGIRCGLAVSPDTWIGLLEPYLPLVDEVLVMSVEPGRAGTSFRRGSLERIRSVREMARKLDREILVSVDGGIDEALADECVASGADKVVMGRAFFMDRSPRRIAKRIHALSRA